MTHKQKQELKFLGIMAVISTVIFLIMNKIFPEIFQIKYFMILITTTVLISFWTVSEKVFMKLVFFIAYHLLIFGTIWWFGSTYLSPFFTEWYGFNWLKDILVFVAKITLWGTFVWSVLSCFSSKKLKKTDVGQWSISGWMPGWGKNEKNSWYGLFLGLPEKMVDVDPIPAVSKVITTTKQIQIEEAGNTHGRKFAAEFEFSFQYKVVDTLTHTLRPNGDIDLINFVVAKLTEWLNEPNNNYKNIKELKEDKKKIQDWLVKELKETGKMYGDEIENFIIVDTEVPKVQIEQQNKDAAARAAQIAADEREGLDLIAAQKQAKKMVKASKDAGDNPVMTFKQALEEIRKQKGITRSSDIKIKGGGRSIIGDIT